MEKIPLKVIQTVRIVPGTGNTDKPMAQECYIPVEGWFKYE